jgi:tripartite-type tricarboxylate transporter receptor subunit TctC
MTPNRRIALIKLLSGCAIGTGVSAQESQSFPRRPVTIVLPFQPGDFLDISVRLLAEALSRKWGRAVIVDNRPGASTLIGTAIVAKAPADGHTILANVSLILQNPLLRKSLPYDPLALVPITPVNTQQLILIARKGAGFRRFEDLVKKAGEAPGSVKYGTIGNGSSTHIILEAVSRAKDLKLMHVPYKGGSEVTRALVANEVDLGVLTFSGVRDRLASGDLVPIAVTGSKRLDALAGVPTLAELGVPGFTFSSWLGLFCQANTPRSIVTQIASDVGAVLSDPVLAARFQNELMVTPLASSPGDFARSLDSERLMWAEHIRATGITLD